MSLALACAMLLGAGVAWSAVQLLRHARTPGGRAPRGGRLVAILLLQAASAVLLYFTLFPPAVPSSGGTLVVLTANSDKAPKRDAPAGAHVVALPEAGASARGERVPDLATALRRYPRVASLHVVGAGLGARDLAAAAGWPLRFDAAPPPRGLAELWSPREVRSGSLWTLSGRVADVAGGRVELRDPGDAVVARASLDGQGRFELQAGARAAGRASFTLVVLDAQAAKLEEVDVPLRVVAGTKPRVLLLAGGVGPELKYLRRWATDAGVRLDSSMEVGPDVRIGDAGAVPDAAGLRALDLVVLDDRAWARLGPAGGAALTQAVREGLGVLLLLTGPLDEAALADLRTLGFAISDAEIPRTITLGMAQPEGTARAPGATAGDGAALPAAGPGPLPELSRRPLRVTAADAAPLLRDAIGSALSVWRAEGRGRIALSWLTDSYRLVLAGHPDLHGTLWSEAFTTLARTRELAGPELRGEPRALQRLQLCRLDRDARVVDPSGAETPLAIDPVAGADACAAYWPRVAGWHELRSAAGPLAFHARGVADAPGLLAQALRDATAQLAARPSAARATPVESGRGSPWRWFFGWLAASAALWWQERMRPRARTEAVPTNA